jgi:CubicO group peptidase (beta-lactamase class C family)
MLTPHRAVAAVLAVLLLGDPVAAQSVAERTAAVEATLDRAPVCRGLGDFYWEVGDTNGKLAAGARGGAVTANRPLRIASASKWIFGAYVVERQGGHPSDSQIDALEMKSGYDQLNPVACAGARTVQGCLERRRNADLTPAHVGLFSYNGGHDQKLAVELGLGALDAEGFAAEMRRVLGRDLAIGFSSPQPAGGMEISPSGYAAFLRKIMGGHLRIAALLGSHPVCTLPSACPQAVGSPLPYAWHYSLNHWIEDAPGEDGAFSSAGAFGFYPWISADRSLYGILARDSIFRHSGVKSAQCGAAIRRAWVNARLPFGAPAAPPSGVGSEENRRILLDLLRSQLGR